VHQNLFPSCATSALLLIVQHKDIPKTLGSTATMSPAEIGVAFCYFDVRWTSKALSWTVHNLLWIPDIDSVQFENVGMQLLSCH